METVGQVLDKITAKGPAPAVRVPTMTLSELSSLRKGIQGLPDGCDETKWAAIVLIVTNVENVSNIHLSDDERNALVRELYDLHETINQIQQRGENVKRADHYGRLGFNLWLGADRVYTASEAGILADQIIEQRRKAYSRALPPSDDELAREGLIELQMYWHNKRREMVEKHVERLEKKCRRLKAQFYQLSEQAKIDLWTKAVAKGLVRDGDPLAMQVVPFLVPMMIEEFEQAIRDASIAKDGNA